MVEKKYRIINELGLHAKPATEMVQIANNYDSEIEVTLGNVKANFKSIMGILSLSALYNDVIIVSFNGVDEIDCANEFSLALIEKNIGKEI